MSRNPNITAQYVNIPNSLTENYKKYIIQGNTPNNVKLDFTQEQKALIPRADLKTYEFAVFPNPYTENLGYETDLVFHQMITPNFDIWVEKIKVCLHQPSTYGCVKINVWNFGNSIENNPTNIINVNTSQPNTKNCPVTLIENEKLISNCLSSEDLYMVNTGQECYLNPFDYTISANSIIRMGIQYAEGNAYGLKVIVIGWAIECD